MLDLTLSTLALKAIVIDHMSSKESLTRVFLNEKLSDASKASLRRRLYKTLRHFYTLSFECLNLFVAYGPKTDETFLNILTLSALRTPSTSSDELKSSYIDTHETLSLEGDPNSDFEVLLKASLKPFVIPENIKEFPNAFYSLSLEADEGYIKELTKKYGQERGLKAIASLHAHPTSFLALNTKAVSSDTFKDDERFASYTFDDGSKVYKVLGEHSLVNLPEVKENKLYPIDLVTAKAFSRLEIPALSAKILLSGFHLPTPTVYFGLKTKDQVGAKVVINYADPQMYRLAMDMKKHFDLNDAYPIPVKISLLKTYYKFDSFDTVVYQGNDSRIGMLRRDPGLLITRSKEYVSSLIKEMDYDLMECSEFVAKGANLLFINHSLLDDETKNVVRSFLKRRKEFSLVEEETVLPMDYDSDGGYYALLRRN